MKLIIHRGTHQIGGNCVEISTGQARIIIDIGMPLEELGIHIRNASKADLLKAYQSRNILPNVPGLFEGEPNIDGILLSHAHGDHYGLAHVSQEDIPVYMTDDTSKMLMAMSVFAGQFRIWNKREKICFRKPSQIKDITVTPFHVDHSAYGASAFLIEADGQRVIYSGDLRCHGPHPQYTEAFLADVAGKQIDALIMEGTRINQSKGTALSEEECLETLTDRARQNKGLVLGMFSAVNVDRLATFVSAAKRTNRTFVIDPYAAFVMHLISRQAKEIPNPFTNENIRTFYPESFEHSMKRRKISSIFPKIQEKRIQRDDLYREPHKYLMVVRSQTHRDYFHGKLPPNTLCVYSYWQGYLEQPGMKKLMEEFDALGVSMDPIHAGGHIFADDIKTLVEKIQPKTIIPIHTQEREVFQKMFSNVRLLEDGELWDVGGNIP